MILKKLFLYIQIKDLKLKSAVKLIKWVEASFLCVNLVMVLTNKKKRIINIFCQRKIKIPSSSVFLFTLIKIKNQLICANKELLHKLII